MSQNLFKLFTDDPVEYNMKHLKVHLNMALITLIRDKGWTQSEAAKTLNITAPRMSNLFKGHLEKFSIDSLLEMLVRLGYNLDVNFVVGDTNTPLTINVKISTESI